MNNLLLTQQMAPSERVTNLEASTTWAFYLNDTLPRIIRVSLKEFIFQASSQGYGTLRGLWQLRALEWICQRVKKCHMDSGSSALTENGTEIWYNSTTTKFSSYITNVGRQEPETSVIKWILFRKARFEVIRTALTKIQVLCDIRHRWLTSQRTLLPPSSESLPRPWTYDDINQKAWISNFHRDTAATNWISEGASTKLQE